MIQLLIKSFAFLALLLLGGTSTLSAQVKVKIAPSIKQETQKDGSLMLRSAKPMKATIEGQTESVMIGTIASLSCACGDQVSGSCILSSLGCVGTCCGLVIGHHDSMLKVEGGGSIIISEDIADIKKQ